MLHSFGVLTLDERMESFERGLFAVRKYDIRHLIADMSIMTASNDDDRIQ